MDDPIRRILTRTDAAYDVPPPARNISERVRKRARNQGRRRVVLGGLAVVALVLGIVWIPRPKAAPVVAVHIAAPPAEDVRSAEIDAKYHQMVAGLLEKEEWKVVQRDASKADEFLWELSQERNRAALILVGSGDRIYEEFGDRTAAEANYRQVIHLFPDSPAAAKAQQRLRSFDGVKGRES